MMKNKTALIVSILIITCSIIPTCFGMFPLNFFRPYDINLRPPEWRCAPYQFTGYGEVGFKTRAYNEDGHRVNVMQIWQDTQDSIAMLQGFPSNSDITNFYNNVLLMSMDDGVTGHFKVTGDFDMKLSAGIFARYHLPHHFTIGLYLPFYDMQLKNVRFHDLTPVQDAFIRDELTSKLQSVVHMFDPSLNLSGWSRSGVGDLTALAEWWRDFPQNKPILKNVTLEGRLGLSFPSGVRKNENDILSVPFGLDGSVGLIFGGGIALTWADYVRGGIDVEFLHAFSNSRIRRIKVHENQTEFLLLAKAPVLTDYGFNHRFNLYLEAYRIWHGLTAGVVYQMWKQGDNSITLCTNQFSNAIANTAPSLEEWTMHQFIFKLSYDFQYDVSLESSFKPQILLFYKFPFNGKRSLMASMLGAAFTLNF